MTMNVRNIIIVVVIMSLIGGLIYTVLTGQKKDNKAVVSDSASSLLYLEGNNLYLNTEGKLMSSLSLVLVPSGDRVIDSFVVNGDVFNSEFKNEVAESKLRLVLGIMKSSGELPFGKVLLGQFNSNGVGQLTVESGNFTAPATSGGKAIKVVLDNINVEIKE